MHVDKVFLTLLICAICAIVNCSETTNLTRTARSFPASLWPSRWSQTLSNAWNWQKNNAASLFRLVAFPDTSKGPMIFTFKPEDGPRAAYEYQRRFGYRGERLIEAIGSGLPPNGRLYSRPIPAFELMPPLPQ